MIPVAFLDNRRQAKRFPLRLPVRYTLLPEESEAEVVSSPASPGPALVHPNPHSGTGELVDISSHGVSFTTSTLVSPGRRVELQVPWPALLNGQTPLKLVIQGVIVRVDQDCAAMRIRSHEFRTAKLRAGLPCGPAVTRAPRLVRLPEPPGARVIRPVSLSS